VVEFAERFVKSHYKANGQYFYSNPLEALDKMIMSLDSSMKEESA
jgi:hypothetical protein